jgi:hypothetical protein
MWEEQDGAFRYTSCPKTGVSPILTMIMANGLAFAANYSDDAELRDIVRRAFSRGLATFQGNGPGNSILYGLPINSAPMAIAEISHFPGIGFGEYARAMLEAELSPARRPVPALVPNPDFEETGDGWRTRPDLVYQITTEVAHTGSSSAMASGLIAKQGEYLVTWYACGPPWEIVWLEPGRSYRAQLWLRVDRLGEGIPAPHPRVAFRSKGSTKDAVYMNAYDIERMGEWQLLTCDFEVPNYYDALYIAVSTGTSDPQEDVLMYLDDIAIVEAGTPERETYVYPGSSAEDAALDDGLVLRPDEYVGAWKAISAPDGKSGTATFTISAPVADTYRAFVRGVSPDEDAAVNVSIDGNGAGQLAIAKGLSHAWIELGGTVELAAGDHEVTLSWPDGCGAVVQKVCLTNELMP